MHIMEGYLPIAHAAGWFAAAAPFVIHGAGAVKRRLAGPARERLQLGASGGFCFTLSALRLPSVAGSCSHATGAGLGAILFGPPVMAVLGTIVLLFQAILLAHGGLTTLGANVFSMAVAGPWVSWVVYRAARGLSLSRFLSAFLAASMGDLATYAVTSLQLALAFPDPAGGVAASFLKFGAIFLPTQLPLAAAEGVVTALVLEALRERGPEVLRENAA